MVSGKLTLVEDQAANIDCEIELLVVVWIILRSW